MTSPPTNRRLRTILRVLLPIAVLAAGLAGARALIESRERAETEIPEPTRPIVEVLEVVPTDHPVRVRTTGTVQPTTASELVAEVAGRVTWVADELADGAFFAADAVLARIDPRDFELAVVEAEAEVARAELALERERAEAASARREWQTMQLGGEPPPLVVREPQLRDAEATLAAAQARLEARRRDLERTTVRAPYAGRVLEKSVDLGQFVSRGTRLGRIYATATADVRLPIDDAALRFLDLDTAGGVGPANGEAHGGPAVTVRAEFAGTTQSWPGRVVRTEGQLDPRTRMVQVIARIDGPYAVDANRPVPLVVGTFVEAEIHGRTLHDVVVLPRAALRDDSRVVLVDAEGRLVTRRVEVLRRERDTVAVGDGLQAGDRVCLTTLEAFVDGMPVRIAGESGTAGTEDSRR